MRSFTILTALAALATSTLASIDSNGHTARPHGRRSQRSTMRRLRRAGPVEVLKLAVVVPPTVSSAEADNSSAVAASSSEVAKTSKRAATSTTRAQTSTTSTASKSSPTPIKLSTPSYNSTAIWYATTGFVTSCNVTISSDDDIIALPEALYSNGHQVSDFCGQSVLATNPTTGAQVVLKVASASWRSEYTIVTRNTFIALGGVPVEGELPISFQFLRASVAKEAVHEVKLYAISSSAAAAASASSADAAAFESASLSKAAASKSVSLEASASAAFSRSAAATAKADAKAKADAEAKAQAQADAKVKAQAQAGADEAEAHSSSVAASTAAASKPAAERTTTTEPKKTTAPILAKEETTEKAKPTPVKAVVVATTPATATTTSAASSSSSSSGGSSSGGSSSGGSSGGGGSDDAHTGGYATFYTQNGVAGNCGTVAQDSDYVIALPTAMYANGAHCGKKIVVTRVSDGAKVTATVRDSCPTCVNNECLDLSVAAFTAIATEAEGMVSITWQWAA